jgi:hypothetical protein
MRPIADERVLDTIGQPLLVIADMTGAIREPDQGVNAAD